MCMICCGQVCFEGGGGELTIQSLPFGLCEIAMIEGSTIDTKDIQLAGAEKLKVFISYSRRDAQAFADELAGGLEFQGAFEVGLDRRSIVEGEDWKKRLGALIADADTVVFVVSPGSARSEICKWEVNEATKLSKRILPVLWLAPQEGQRVTERIAELHYTVRRGPLDRALLAERQRRDRRCLPAVRATMDSPARSGRERHASCPAQVLPAGATGPAPGWRLGSAGRPAPQRIRTLGH